MPKIVQKVTPHPKVIGFRNQLFHLKIIQKMKSKRNFFVWDRHVLSETIEGQMRVFLFLILLMGIPFSRIAAQSQMDAVEAGLEVIATQQTIDDGENAVFEVRLKESAAPLTNVIGFEFRFELFPEISPARLLDFLGSCIPADAQTLVTIAYTASTHTVHISLADAAAFTMAGGLFRIELNHKPGQILVEQVIQATGGFIIVEDIGFKQAGNAGSSTVPQPVVFPTYAQGMLHFDFHGAQPLTVTLADVRGAQVAIVPEIAIQAGSWAITGLPSGHYKVVIGYATGRQVVRDVWVQ
jgi:hypothetical protein